MFCFVKMKEKQAHLLQKHAEQKCHKHTSNTIPWHQEVEMTETHTHIHIKQKPKKKKQQPAVTFLKRGRAMTANLLMHS